MHFKWIINDLLNCLKKKKPTKTVISFTTHLALTVSGGERDGLQLKSILSLKYMEMRSYPLRYQLLVSRDQLNHPMIQVPIVGLGVARASSSRQWSWSSQGSQGGYVLLLLCPKPLNDRENSTPAADLVRVVCLAASSIIPDAPP